MAQHNTAHFCPPTRCEPAPAPPDCGGLSPTLKQRFSSDDSETFGDDIGRTSIDEFPEGEDEPPLSAMAGRRTPSTDDLRAAAGDGLSLDDWVRAATEIISPGTQGGSIASPSPHSSRGGDASPGNLIGRPRAALLLQPLTHGPPVGGRTAEHETH